jgi:hypothetical protein
MPQEVIDRVNQLGKADAQPELLTFYDRKGHLIGESNTTGAPDPAETASDKDRTEDLNPPTVNEDYQLKEEPDTDHFIEQQPEEQD